MEAEIDEKFTIKEEIEFGFNCFYCDATFTIESDLINHQNSHKFE